MAVIEPAGRERRLAAHGNIGNALFAEPACHFVVTPDGKATGEIASRRRVLDCAQ